MTTPGQAPDRRAALDPDLQLRRIRRLYRHIITETGNNSMIHLSPDMVLDLAESVAQLDRYLSAGGMQPKQWE